MDHPLKYDHTETRYNPTGQRQNTHTAHQKQSKWDL